MTANLQNPIFTDETKAREWLEARVWPQGPVCPHCGSTGEDVTALKGKAHRPGLYQCAGCREQFTVTVKTVFERSKIPLSKWLAALFLMTASKKGVSAHQIHRMLKISYKSAWFMMHRLREAMRPDSMSPLGGGGKIVESDETYIGKLAQAPKGKHGKGYKNAHGKPEHFDPEETFLPDSLAGRRYYEPTDLGAEAALKSRVDSLRRSVTAAARARTGDTSAPKRGSG